MRSNERLSNNNYFKYDIMMFTINHPLCYLNYVTAPSLLWRMNNKVQKLLIGCAHTVLLNRLISPLNQHSSAYCLHVCVNWFSRVFRQMLPVS